MLSTTVGADDDSGGSRLAATGAPIVAILLIGISLIAAGAAGQLFGRRPGRHRGIHRAPARRRESGAVGR
jgi:hypothetical protein